MKKVGIIGFGGMGGWHAWQIMGDAEQPKSDVVELKGVWDTDPAKLERAKRKGLIAYASQEDLLADPEIEIVVVATPNDYHEPIAIAALDAGKNVIVEKPVTMSCEALENMIAASERNGKLFTVHQNRRYDSYFRGMKQIVEDGTIGDILSLESRILGDHGVPGDWRKTVEHGGGMLYDWGVHMIDQQLWLFGYDVDRVYAHLENPTGVPVDDGCYIEIYFKNGLRTHVEIATYDFGFEALPIMYMRGRTGGATFWTWGKPIHVTRCTDWSDQDDILPIKIDAGLSRTIAPRNERTMEEFDVPLPTLDVHDYYRNFCDAIDGKCEQLVKHDEMRMVMRVIMAAFESAKNQTVVKL